MPVGVLTLKLHLPGCNSLKEKRRRIKPLRHRLQREFNVSVAEIGALDAWQQAVLGCAVISNDAAYAHRVLQSVLGWVEKHWHEGWVESHRVEII